jgi:hypothetical protein
VIKINYGYLITYITEKGHGMVSVSLSRKLNSEDRISQLHDEMAEKLSVKGLAILNLVSLSTNVNVFGVTFKF